MSLENDLLTINEAARVTGKSLMTIRKALGLTVGATSQLPNARKVLLAGDKQERWQIPLSDLHNAGLMKGGSSQQADKATPKETDREQIIRLSVENAGLRREIELLERNRLDLEQSLADLRLVLGRSIETAEKQEERRKRFWQRSSSI
jgi:hypothetical protein